MDGKFEFNLSKIPVPTSQSTPSSLATVSLPLKSFSSSSWFTREKEKWDRWKSGRYVLTYLFSHTHYRAERGEEEEEKRESDRRKEGHCYPWICRPGDRVKANTHIIPMPSLIVQSRLHSAFFVSAEWNVMERMTA